MSGNSRATTGWTRLLWAVVVPTLMGFTPAVGAEVTVSPQAIAVALSEPQGGKPTVPSPDAGKNKPKGRPNDNPELWDPGDEVVPPKPLPNGRKSGDAAKPAGGATTDAATDSGGPAWSVLLGTFTGEDHATAANAARERLAARIPEVNTCFIRRVQQGSVLLVGRFSGPADPAAQAKLKELKALVVDGQRPFATAMLTRVATDAEPPGPYDVRRLRQRFPNVKPLYSLQVAAWSTFGEKGSSRPEMRTAAENYCKELRAKNVEAWVHHDDDSGTSIVTVGHFDHTAYDSKSTLFSPDVERFKKQFPRHLVNGAEVLIPIDPRKPDGAKRPQGCQLVEIPLF